jgi:hypothetical protein
MTSTEDSTFADQLEELALDLGAKADMWARDAGGEEQSPCGRLSIALKEASDKLFTAAEAARELPQ